MSMQAITAVRTYAEARGSALALLLVIADGIDTIEDGMYGRTLRNLAEYAHLFHFDATPEQVANAERRCRRLLSHLIDSGELVVERGSGRVRSAYHIPILPGEQGYDPKPCADDTHTCCGLHTPLSISREELYRVAARAQKEANIEQIRAQRENTRIARERRKGHDLLAEQAQGGPISPPSEKTARGGANKPPQGGPISPPREGLETPPGRANKPPRIYKEKSHINPIDNPNGIPGAFSSLKTDANEPPDEPEAPDPLAEFTAAYPDVTAYARKTGRRWGVSSAENAAIKGAFWVAGDQATAAHRRWLADREERGGKAEQHSATG